MKEHAKAYARKGFYVFPLKKNGKKPLSGSNGFYDATRDEEIIEKLWGENEYNIGIDCSRYKENEALLVVDIDVKNGKNGYKTIEQLQMMGMELSDTCIVETPSGGRHYYYSVPVAVKQGTSVLGEGVDIRSKGGYVAAPPSIYDGNPYTFLNECEPKPAHQWVIDMCNQKKEVVRELSPPKVDINLKTATIRAIQFLENEYTEAVEGERNATAFKVACRLKEFGVPKDMIKDLMLEYWNCIPMLDESELETCIWSAFKNGSNPPGSDSPEAHFEVLNLEGSSRVEEYNKDHAFIIIGGRHFVLKEEKDNNGKIHDITLLEENTFHAMNSYDFVVTERGTKIFWSKEWVKSPNRRTFDKGFRFEPEEKKLPSGAYNLWSGFTKKPVPYRYASAEAQEGFDLFMYHIKENIAQGVEEYATYITAFFADLFQNPGDKPGVALVLAGNEGNGKTVLLNLIGRLLGKMYLSTGRIDDVLGNFTSALEGKLLISLEEVTWGGDKQSEGRLKHLITSDTITVNKKFKPSYELNHYSRCAILSNERWVVPSSLTARRYAIFEVGDKHRRDYAFFNKMVKGMEAGGDAILLDHLLKFDLSTVNLRQTPATEKDADQKLLSLDIAYKWWVQMLMEGEVEFYDGKFFGSYVHKDVFRDLLRRFISNSNSRSFVPSPEQVTKMIKKVCPEFNPTRIRVDGKRYYVYKVPKLEEARKNWNELTGMNLNFWKYDMEEEDIEIFE